MASAAGHGSAAAGALEPAAGAEYRALRRTLRGLWPSLPTLACGGAAVCAAWALATLVAPGITPVSVLLAAFLVAPFATALTAAVNEIAHTGETTLRTWARSLPALWWFGTAQALVPASASAVFLVALSAWRHTSSMWWLPSLGVSGACATLTLLALAAVLPLGAARPDLRGRTLWICGLWLLARHPQRFAAAASVGALGLWASAAWTASLLPLVPAPTVIVAVSAVWTSMASCGPEGGERALSGETARCGPEGFGTGDPGRADRGTEGSGTARSRTALPGEEAKR